MAKRKPIIHRPMSVDEYKTTLNALGLSKHTAATLIGYSPRMSRRYGAGEWPVPTIVAAILRLMEHRGVLPAELDLMKLPALA